MEDILTGMLLSIFFNCLLSQVLPRDVVAAAGGWGSCKGLVSRKGACHCCWCIPFLARS